MHPSVVSLPLFVTAASSVAVGAYVWSKGAAYRRRPDVRAFFGIIVGASVWAVGYALQLFSPTQALAEASAGIALVGTAVFAVAWPLFALTVSGHRRWATRQGVAVLSAIPALTVFVGFALPDSELLVTTTDTSGYLWTFSQFGPVLVLFVGYAAVAATVSYGVLLLRAGQTAGIVRRQYLTILVAGLLPIVGGLVPQFSPDVFPYNPTPLWFAIAVPTLGWALTRYHLFELVPVARRRVLDELTDGIVVLDAAGDVAYLNQSMTERFGCGDESIGTPAVSVFADYPAFAAALVTDGSTFEFHVERDGADFFFEGRSTPLRSTGGDVAGRIVVLRDITDRRRYEIRFRTLVEQSPALVSILDEEGTLTYLSPAYERQLGFETDSLVGTPAIELVHPTDRDVLRTAFENVREAAAEFHVEYRVQRDDGVWRHFESVGTDMFDVPFIDGLVVTSHDVTDRKRGEQRQQVLNRVLRHDLRNDMNLMLGYLELLGDHVDAEGEPYLDIVTERGEEIIEMSDKATIVDRLVTDERTHTEAVDLAELLRSLVAKSRREFPELEIETAIPDECYVVADELVRSAFDNVVENAIEHNPGDRPTLRVDVRRTEVEGRGYAEVRVSDNGPQIPENEIRVIETGSETSLEHASGLGLWLVSWIVQRSGGDLFVDRRDGEGNTIRIQLPLSEQMQHATTDQ